MEAPTFEGKDNTIKMWHDDDKKHSKKYSFKEGKQIVFDWIKENATVWQDKIAPAINA